MLMQNTEVGSKNRIASNMQRTFLKAHLSCFMQKTAAKNANIRKMRAF